MKNFFKYVLATIVGIFGFIMIMTLSFFLFLGISALFSSDGKKPVKNESILQLDFSGPIYENASESEDRFFALSNEPKIYYKDILHTIEAAAEDDRVKGISMNLFNVAGGATQIAEIRKRILDFKKKGKFVYAYGNLMSQKAYFLSTAADSIFLNPVGSIELKGLSSEVMFYKNMGEKYGIDFQVIRHGKYKSAVEPYIREDLSEENREQLTEILMDIWGNMAEEMATSRGLSMEAFNQATDSLYSFLPEKALSEKLVDVLVQESEYYDFLQKKMDVDQKDDLNFLSVQDYFPHLEEKSSENKIAIIYASGMITNGNSPEGISSEPYKELIQELDEDEDIKAVVLRVDSGGGSANASDEILFELQKLNTNKPLVVSFGDIAASGGYYIAMAGRKIFAEPNTITGSIGVLGMIPSIKKLSNNVGITTDYVNTNANSVIYSPLSLLSEGTEHVLVQGVETTYDRFLNMVAKNRKKSVAEIDSIAQGRVWSGQRALQIGLVDELGGLEEAITYAAELAELDHYEVNSYPKPEDEFQKFLREIQSYPGIESYMKEELGEEEYKVYQQIRNIKNMDQVQMYTPFSIRF